MSLFRYFPTIEYLFGDEKTPDRFRDISIYADVFDELRNNIAFYQNYTIKEFERPDQVSYKFYNTAEYHWTFYLMNNHIRERGWPLTNRELIAKAAIDYPLLTMTTRTTLIGKFQVGQTVTGNTSGATGTINSRRHDLGQVILSNVSGSFTAGEVVSSTNADEEIETITATSTSLEYNAAHHYTNAAGEWVDIDPAVGPGALLTEVTHLDRFVENNDELKEIRVIKPSVVNDVVKAFREAIRS